MGEGSNGRDPRLGPVAGRFVHAAYDELAAARRAKAQTQPDPASAPAPPAEGDGLWFDGDTWDEAQIPPRPWIAPGFLLAGAVTVLGGIGSGGKSSLCVQWACALALGRPVGRFEPVEACRVLLFNVEDDRDEQRRRFSAALRQFGATPADLAGQVMRVGTNGSGALVETDPETGGMRTTAAYARLEEFIATWRPRVVMADPMVELHGCDENDNGALREVMGQLRALARKHGCAIIVAHHVRKGGEAGDMNALRGASAIAASARVVLTVTPMSEEEAREFGIPVDGRAAFFRVDGAKSNYSRRGLTDWQEMQTYLLDNMEEVGACVPWAPPDQDLVEARRRTPPEVMALLEAGIERGCEHGSPWSPRLGLEEPRSVARLFVEHGITDPKRHRQLLRELINTGVCRVADYRNTERKTRRGLRARHGGPWADWTLEAAQCPGEHDQGLGR